MGRDRSADKAFIRSGSQEGRLQAGDAVIIKRVASATAGDPARGIGRTYGFTKQPSKAVIESLTQDDVMNSGGIYQVGDIRVQLNEELHEVVDQVGNIGDRMIWRGVEWRVVGKKDPAVLSQLTPFYGYVMRKVAP